MKKKKGFTLVELISVISILAIILVLVVPNIQHISSTSSSSLKKSKINTLVTVGEKYGNYAINQYKNCVYDATQSELKNDCSVSINELVQKGYIEADDDEDNIIDPESKEPLKGRILLCYNPEKLNVKASYVENDIDYSCPSENVNIDASLNLVSISGKGYVGGDPMYVNIIKSDIEKNSFECTSSDNSVATCDATSSTKLRLDVVAEDFDDVPSKEVTITLNATSTKGQKLRQTYTLVVYPTRLSIDTSENADVCLPKGETHQFGIVSVNAGDLTVTSSNEEILKGSINKTTLSAISLEKTGEATLTVKEANGNRTAEVTRNVYSLKSNTDFPEGLLLGNVETIELDYSGNESVTVESSNPGVIALSNGGAYANKVTLSGEQNSFTMKVVGTGDVKIAITGNPCGKIEKDIVVSNLYVKQHDAKVYVGGDSFQTEVVAATQDGYRCETSDENVATCSMSGTTVEIKPGSVAGLASIKVIGQSGGEDTVTVENIKTTLELVNEQGTVENQVCSWIDTTNNDRKVSIKAENNGVISISKISDTHLATVDILDGELLPKKIFLSDAESPYINGYNTGVVEIETTEANGKVKAPLNYYIYDIGIPQETVEVIAGETTTLEIPNFASGPLRAVSSDESVARVSVENPTNYSYDLNAENKSQLTIEALRTGSFVITITGEHCGNMSFNVEVVGKTFKINTPKGSYTDFIGERDEEFITCSTSGSNTSCETEFPDIKPKYTFTVSGYSATKDTGTPLYKPGDKITLSSENDGITLYANSIDTTKPVCEFRKPLTSIIEDTESTVTLMCNETGSGSDSKLTKDSFIVSNPDAAEIVSVEDPVEVVDEYGREGYTVKITFRGGSFGSSFDLTLKEGQFTDKYGNTNDETKFSSVFVGKYDSYKFWYVGKENSTDVIAVLYINKDLPDEINPKDDNNYTLMLYGTGATKDYNTGSEGDNPPWLAAGYQESITSIIIQEGITEIGDATFYANYNLEDLKIPEGVTKIGTSAFAFLKKITNIELPSTIVTLGDSAFEMCLSLENISLNNGLKTIGTSAFRNTHLSEVTIPNTVTSISSYAFYSDYDGESEVLEPQLQQLTFEENSQLQTISFSAFENNRFSTLNIPASVAFIGDSAFMQNSESPIKLQELSFEENSSLSIINDYAFSNNNLENVDLPDSVTSIGRFVFDGLLAKTIKVGPNVSSLHCTFAQGDYIEEYTVDPNNSSYTSVDGVIYSKDMQTLIKCPINYAIHSELNIPDGVTTVGSLAFAGWMKYDPQLKTFAINMPNTITELNIADNFIGMAISEFNIDTDDYKSVDGVLYSKDLKKVYRLPTHYANKEYTILDETTEVDDYFAYININVETVTLPNSIIKVGTYAFVADPNHAFKNIYFGVSDDCEIDETSLLTAYLSDDADYSKNVYVNTNYMKDRLLTMYTDNIIGLNVIVRESNP